MSRFARLVFDLDGTLVDSAPDLHAAANAMLADLGRPPLTLAQVTSFIGNGVPKLVGRCLEATGGTDGLQRDALAGFRRHYDADPARLTRPFPGVVDAARALRVAGCRLGICTNKPEAPARRLLDALGMGELFGAVVGGDSLAVSKPDPAPLRHAIELLGGDEAPVLYVGDSETDAATAANAGVPFALFTRGYRKAPVESFDAALAFAEWSGLAEFVLVGGREGRARAKAIKSLT